MTTPGAGETAAADPEALASVDRAIAALQAQRALLGDDVVDTALQPLVAKREAALVRGGVEQRKLVTVVFADLVDFTVLSGVLDPEDTREVLGAYFARWREAIAAAGGTVEKYIGDAVMAVFGLYRSREDDARQAVRCTLAVRRALAQLNEQLEARHGLRLRMRVGIDTGDVVVSTLEERPGHEFVAVGPTVNRASRLQGAAAVDGILLSVETYRQVRGWFTFEPAPGLRLKGIESPVDGYHVLAERPHGFQLDRAGGIEGVDSATVGREPELRDLQERLLDVVEDQRWQVVTIVGDAGVGKSRLLLDFDHWLGQRSDNVWWFRGRATPSTENVPGALLRDLMATRLGIQESDPPQVVRDKCQRGAAVAFGDGEDARRAAEVVAAWLGFELGGDSALPRDPQSLREQGTNLLAEYFARLATTAPVIILLEDLHWADDGSLRWLDAADVRLRAAPVLVVATARPSLLEVRPHWGEGLDQHSRIGLEPLSRRHSRQLVGELLQKVDEVPEEVVRLVVDSAEGNPFYIEELVTWLIDARVIVPGPDRWSAAAERIGSLAVPSTLKGVLQSRLDALSGPERRVLQRASVIGRVFWDDAVRRLGGGPDNSVSEADTAQNLERLRRRELVFERELSAFDRTHEFLFKHALFRDVAYDSVLRSQRAAYHGLVARWLVDVCERNQRADEFAALVAEHYDQAGDPACTQWYLRAGAQASSVHALAEATRLLSRGLQTVREGQSAPRFDLLALRQQVHDRQGAREQQLADLTAMGESIPSDDIGREVRWLLARSAWAFARSDYGQAVSWARTATERAAAAGLAADEADALLWWGKALAWEGDNAGSYTVLARALAASRDLGARRLEGETLRYLSLLANNEGDYAAAERLAEDALAVQRQDGDADAQSVTLAHFATTYFLQGRYAEARACLEETLPIFRASGHRYREAIALGNLASISFEQGELAAARDWCQQSVALSLQIEDQESSATNLNLLGQIAMALGRWAEAVDQLNQALDIGVHLESWPIQADSLVRLGYVAMEEGRLEEAAELLRAAREAAGQAASSLETGHADAAQGYLARLQGDLDESAAAFDAGAQVYAGLEMAAARRECLAGSAWVALRRGRLDESLAVVEQLLPHLDVPGLTGSARPTAVLQTCCEVLVALHDGRADDVRERAARYVADRAAAIGDEQLAAQFLATSANRGLLAGD
ncbi:ATP-binding protein [Angustibacter sp. McL0619]|uniref:ATP-binding protein n=1 Tax=Angustibacter sp. McL0619 TaxID=3415676 RepID=UPI003CF3EE4C